MERCFFRIRAYIGPTSIHELMIIFFFGRIFFDQVTVFLFERSYFITPGAAQNIHSGFDKQLLQSCIDVSFAQAGYVMTPFVQF